MRTEQEIRNRIHELEHVMNIAITRYYREDDSQEIFEQIYSDVWDEMKTLHWVLGMTQTEASNYVAHKVMKMSDEIRAKIKNQQ